MPAKKNEDDEYDLSDIYFDEEDSDDIVNEHHLLLENYLERLDANAKRLNRKSVCERVAQGAIRDMIKSNDMDSRLEVAPGESTLRRMDIYGELAPGRHFVVEVKMGFDNFIGGVAQLNYYCHLLTQAGRKPTSLILAFHDEDAQKVPWDVFNFCDAETITACKAEEVAMILAGERKQILKSQKHLAKHGGLDTKPNP